MKNEDIFQTSFEGTISNKGDKITHPDTDVFITVPPGAIPTAAGSVAITAKVTLLAEYFNTIDPSRKPREVQVSPIVECCADGLEGPFLQPVVVSIPHCAYLLDKAWVMTPKVAQGSLQAGSGDGSGPKVEWQLIERKQVTQDRQQDVSFIVTDNFVHIYTHHFTSFTCTACEKSTDIRGKLQLSAVIYGSHYSPSTQPQQVNLRQYICNDYKDAHKVSMIWEQFSTN